MPRPLQAWYGVDDLEALADRQAAVSGTLDAAKLTRLAPLLHGDDAAGVEARLSCGRAHSGRLTLTLSLTGALSVVCQRCLEPLSFEFNEQLEWVVVESDTAAQAVDEGLEPLVVDDRLNPEQLIEDELIVALPMIPRHVNIDDCGPLAQNFENALMRSGE